MVSIPAFQAGDRCSIPLVRNLLNFFNKFKSTIRNIKDAIIS